MRTAGIGALVFALLTAGCSGVKPTAPVEAPQSAAPQSGGGAVVPAAPAPAPAPPSPPQRPVAAQSETPAVAAATSSTAPAPAAKSTAKAEAPAAKAPAKAPAAPAPAAQPPKKDIAQEPAKPKAEAPLDLTSLETRLKETKAIGLMTKIALKNQVDDLLNQFRAFYAGKLQTTLADLRRPYDLLVLKVLSLLQDSDPALAAAIVASREAIWGILSDRMKFANFASN
jgi:hypothetical protein